MGRTILPKILEAHSDSKTNVDDIIDVNIDIRAARDFGGASVVKNIEENGLPVAAYNKTIH